MLKAYSFTVRNDQGSAIITVRAATRTEARNIIADVECCPHRAILDRMEKKFHQRKGTGAFITNSQPPDNEDLAELMREHPAFRKGATP